MTEKDIKKEEPKTNKQIKQERLEELKKELNMLEKKDGGLVRGAGKAIRGTKFKGVF